MLTIVPHGVAVAVFSVLFAFNVSPAVAQATAYGGTADLKFARSLWTVLRQNALVGQHRHNVWPVKGEKPHGVVQQIASAQLRFGRQRRTVIVKANHRGPMATPKTVYAEPNRFLTGYAVMMKRYKGYHSSAGDWFWVVYNPDGTVRRFENRPIAGRVDTGDTNGCIGCHRKEGGEDFQALTQR